MLRHPCLRVLVVAALAVLPEAAARAADPPADSLAARAPDTTIATIILVRHAERDTMLIGPDQPLTAAGLLRAQTLRHVLGPSGIDAIYVTPWWRNRQTAMPTATALGESLTVIDAVAETVTRLRTRHWGETVLVVGHSNTVPDIIAALTGRPFPETRVPYDGMWIVTLMRDGRAALVTLRYGEPVAPAAAHPPAPAPARR